MAQARIPVSLLLGALLLFAPGRAAAGGMGPGPKDRCPVCGMLVQPFAESAAVVEFRDGSRLFFDGPVDMFTYLFGMEKYEPRRTRGDVAAVQVTEYHSRKLLPAAEVYFITDSDVLGPMGKDLIPVAGRDKAGAFLAEHRGKRMIRFQEVGPKDLPGAAP